jgi:CHASE3 domain sensor protein
MYLYQKAREVHYQDLRREAENSRILAHLPGPRRSMSRHIASQLGFLLLKLGTWLQQFEQAQPTLEDRV